MRYQLKENQGRHILRNGAQRLDVLAGHIVDDSQWRIPSGMKADFVALDPEPEKQPKYGFKIESRQDGYFNVLHPITGAAINSKRLRKVDAEALAGTTVEEHDARVAKEADEAEAARLAAEEAERQTAEGEAGDKTEENASDKTGEGEGA